MINVLNCKPIRKNVLLRVYEWPDMTKSGIYLPDMMKYSSTTGGKDPWRGKIVAIGDEVTQVKVGEIVRYQPNNYYRQTIEQDGVRYIVLDELVLYAVEDENENLIRALKNRVVLLPDEIMEKKYGRIYLPQTREEKMLHATVVVAGEGCPVEKGDRVMIENRSTFQYFSSAGERYIITDRTNLLAIVETDIT